MELIPLNTGPMSLKELASAASYHSERMKNKIKSIPLRDIKFAVNVEISKYTVQSLLKNKLYHSAQNRLWMSIK